jgi:zinc protease
LPDAKPDRAVIPDAPDIAELLKDFKGEAAIAAGEAFDPSPQNIESRTTRVKFPGGIQVALLPKKTRGSSVIATLVFRHGDEKRLQNRSAVASMTGAMLMRGTQKHTRQQIQEEFDRLKARAGISGSLSRAGGSLETIRENLPAVLTLVAEILREPSFPEKEFDLLKEETLAEIEQQRTDPQALAQLELERHLNQFPPGDPRYVMTIDEEIAATKAVTLEQVRQFYKEFYGGSAGQIAVVGDFDKDEIQKHLTNLFDSWKSPGSYERIPDVYQDIPPENKAIPVSDKPNSIFLAGLNLNIRDDDPDYPALAFGNYILGEASNARLNERIREKEGLSYGVGSYLYANPLDKAGGFGSYAIQAPENVQRVENAFMEELKKALTEGYTEDEIMTAKSGYKESERLRRTQDRDVSVRLASYLFLNRTFAWDEEFENKIMALNKQQVQDAMKRHLDPAKITIVKAGDFKASK